jgi:hypothetical protein
MHNESNMELTDIRQKWEALNHVKSTSIRDVMKAQHEAAQLVAVAGKFLSPPGDKTSPGWLHYSTNHKLIYSDIIKGDGNYRVGLHMRDFTIEILTEELELISMFDLIGHTNTEGFNFIEKQLLDRGVDVSPMKLKLDYNLPSGPAAKERSYKLENVEAIKESLKYRNNIILLLNHLRKKYPDSTDIRISPYHFDTAILLPQEKEGDHIISAIAAGLAIHDEMVDVPYFYVNYRSEKPVYFPAKMPLIRYGQWSLDEWKGAFFKITNIYDLSPEKQPEAVLRFFESIIRIIKDLRSENT